MFQITGSLCIYGVQAKVENNSCIYRSYALFSIDSPNLKTHSATFAKTPKILPGQHLKNFNRKGRKWKK